jgi:hypothetical protein
VLTEHAAPEVVEGAFRVKEKAKEGRDVSLANDCIRIESDVEAHCLSIFVEQLVCTAKER